MSPYTIAALAVGAASIWDLSRMHKGRAFKYWGLVGIPASVGLWIYGVKQSTKVGEQ